MPTTLPVTFVAAPLDSTQDYTPQQFLDALVARLSIQTQQNLVFFTSGNVVPTSNVGPFLLGDTMWMVWDVVTGAYIPQRLASESLRYAAASNDLDPNKFTFQIRLNDQDKAIDIQYYSGGAWKSIFEDKFATYSTTEQMDTAIAAATSGAYQASCACAAENQLVNAAESFTKINFGTEVFDTDDSYDPDTSLYTAKAAGIYRVTVQLQVDNVDANAAGMEVTVIAVTGGVFPTGIALGTSSASPPGARWYVNGGGLVQLTQGTTLELQVRAQDGVNTGKVSLAAFNTRWSVELVKAT
jgi:TATA-box binding protein (TBP) (component of TFIID and TFIIIB)